jgi:hypothetical protein
VHVDESEHVAAGQPVLQSAAFLFDYSMGSVDESVWKAALLFFDLIAVKASERTWRGISASDSDIELLAEQGFVRWLPSEDLVDRAFAEQLGNGIVDLLVNGAFAHVPRDGSDYTYFDGTRTGYFVDQRFSDFMVEAIVEAGLARSGSERGFYRIHPTVAHVLAAMITQLTRSVARSRYGLDLHPVTPDGRTVQDLTETLRLPAFALADRIVEMDFEAAGVDLKGVPVAEILEFRARYGQDFRRYAENVRRFATDLSLLNDAMERESRMIDRREELAQEGVALRMAAWRRWRKPLARLGLGIAGATWAAEHGQFASALLTLAGGVLGAAPEKTQQGAFTYVLRAERTLKDRWSW